jgi:CubicO group peptidase (beta-lactamase class C family)
VTNEFHEVMAEQVESGAMPGLAALIAHAGEVDIVVAGTKDFGDAEPLGRDAIFRIASLTKPIVSTAAMILVDRGVIGLHDAVDELLPELANRRVLRTIESQLGDTVPASRAITVEDLLSSRLGFGMIMAMPGTYPIQAAIEELDLKTVGPPWPPTDADNDEWMRRFATLPLLDQPGTVWRYNTGQHVLGILVERAAGKPLEAALRELLFDPLGMVDTGFWVPPEKRTRFTTAYAPDPETGHLDLLDRADATSWWAHPPAMPNAAGWLVSTIDDFWSYAQMMAAGGVHDGEQVLGRTSFELMTTNRLTPEQCAGNEMFLDAGGWGLGMGAPFEFGNGGFGWDGGTGTSWRTDLSRDLTGILFTQRAMTWPEPPAVFRAFWACADAIAAV